MPGLWISEERPTFVSLTLIARITSCLQVNGIAHLIMKNKYFPKCSASKISLAITASHQISITLEKKMVDRFEEDWELMKHTNYSPNWTKWIEDNPLGGFNPASVLQRQVNTKWYYNLCSILEHNIHFIQSSLSGLVTILIPKESRLWGQI